MTTVAVEVRRLRDSLGDLDAERDKLAQRLAELDGERDKITYTLGVLERIEQTTDRVARRRSTTRRGPADNPQLALTRLQPGSTGDFAARALRALGAPDDIPPIITKMRELGWAGEVAKPVESVRTALLRGVRDRYFEKADGRYGPSAVLTNTTVDESGRLLSPIEVGVLEAQQAADAWAR